MVQTTTAQAASAQAATEALAADIEAHVQDVVDSLLNKGITIGQMHGLVAEEYEAVYALGYNLYNQGKFDKAAEAFLFLTFYNHLEPRYAKALGAALQMLEHYQQAVSVYTLALVLDAMDPDPMLRVGECLIAMGMVEEAIESLEAAVLAAAEIGRHEVSKLRAQMLLQILRERQAGGTA